MENNSSLYEEDYEEDFFSDPKIQVAILFLYSVVFIFCFFGNLSVVLVISFHWKMRGSTKFCLGNLAFANLCVGIFCIYQDLSLYLIDSWILGKFLCKMYHFINNLSHTASILILVVIAVERYVAIVHPFKCRRDFTTRRLRVIILGVWVLSAVICSPRLYYVATVTNPLPGRNGEPMRSEVICTLQLKIYNSSLADTIQFVLLFLLPLIVISILYTKIGLFLRQRKTFICSFAQTSSATEVDVSKERICEGRGSARNSIGNINRKVSFPQEAVELENIQGMTDYGSFVHASDSTRFTGTTVVRKVLNRQQSILSIVVSRKSSVRTLLKRKSSEGSCSTPNPHKGVIRMLIIIVVTFALCNFPFHLRKLYQIYQIHWNQNDSDSVWSELATPLSFLLMYANCAINPILYAFMSRSFRSSFMDCLRCQIKKPSQTYC